MNIKTKIKNIALLLLVPIFALTFSNTFAKYTFKYNGLGFLVDFTKFTLLDDAFIIEENHGGNSGKIYGAENSVLVPLQKDGFKDMTESEYNRLMASVNAYATKHNKNLGDNWPDYSDLANSYDKIIGILNNVYSDEFFGSESITSYNGYCFFPDSEFIEGDDDNLTSDKGTFLLDKYKISNIKNVAYSVYNNSDEDMVITFELHYYAQKTDSSSNAISFGLYNTTTRGDSIDVNDANIVKGEFPNITTNSERYIFYNSTIPNVCCKRSGGEVKIVDEKPWWQDVEYYPHMTVINPYSIKKAPTLVNGEYVDTNVSRIETNDSSDMDADFDLNDFILNPNETANFNLSLYCGGYGNSSNAGYAFLAAIYIKAEPISKYSDINNYL